jgi:hypothetical protein
MFVQLNGRDRPLLSPRFGTCTWGTNPGRPGGAEGTRAQAYVGGQTAAFDDLATRVSDRLWALLAVVIGLSLILLGVVSAPCCYPSPAPRVPRWLDHRLPHLTLAEH